MLGRCSQLCFFLFLVLLHLSAKEDTAAEMVEIQVDADRLAIEGEWDRVVAEITSHLESNTGVMLVYKPGIYDQHFILKNIGGSSSEAPLIIRAEESGTTIFQSKGGAVTGLRKQENNRWVAEWRKEWDDARLFQNDFLFKEVFSPDELVVGSYFRDEENQVMQLIPFSLRAGKLPLIEYVVPQAQQPFFQIEQVRNIALRGITFRRMSNNVPAVYLEGVVGGEITDCQFVDGLGSGIVIRNSSELSFSGVKALRNQGYGIHLFDTTRTVFKSVEASHNKLHGIYAEYGGDVFFEYNRFVENAGCGIKVFDGKGVWSFRSSFIAKNEGDGIFTDSERAVLLVNESEISFNFGAGLRIGSLVSKLAYNIFVGNGILGRGTEPLGQITLLEPDKKHLEHQWTDNTFMGTIVGVPLFDLPLLPDGFSFLKNNKNLFFQQYPSDPIRVLHIGLSFEEYQELAGTDLDSFEGDPLFYNIDEFDYQTYPQSPLFSKDSWRKRELKDDPSKTYLAFYNDLLDRIKVNPDQVSDKKYISLKLSSLELPSRTLLSADWPYIASHVDQISLDGVPFVRPFDQGVFLRTQGLLDEVSNLEASMASWDPVNTNFRNELILDEPISRLKKIHILASMQGAADIRYHANIILKNQDEEIGRVEVRSPPKEIPWELKGFSDFLNSTTIQNTERSYFHFSGKKTEPYPFFKINEDGEKDVYFLYKMIGEPISSREKVTSIIISTNAASDAKVFIHGITLER